MRSITLRGSPRLESAESSVALGLNYEMGQGLANLEALGYILQGVASRKILSQLFGESVFAKTLGVLLRKYGEDYPICKRRKVFSYTGGAVLLRKHMEDYPRAPC